jgi:hypothetical protein
LTMKKVSGDRIPCEMLSVQLLPAAAVSLRPGPILWSQRVAILAVTVLVAATILRSCLIAVLSLAGCSYRAILLIAGALILAAIDAVPIAGTRAGRRTVSILCRQGKTCQKA